MAILVITAIPSGGGGEANTSSNAGGTGLALPKVGIDLPFKGLVGTGGITVTPTATTIEIDGGAAEALVLIAKVNEAAGVTKGQVVHISGATGGFPQVSLASNDDYAKADVLAIANETKADNQNITITLSGTVANIDTSAFTEGDQLYLGVNGAIAITHPSGEVDAAQRIGHAVKINPSTGSIIVELSPMTIIDNQDLTLRYSLVNQSAGASASAGITVINNLGHRASMSLTGAGHAIAPEQMFLYNEGYGNTDYFLDGNKDHVWYTDVADTHNFSATEKMRLLADGQLITEQQCIRHVAVNADDHAIEIHTEAAGFGDVKAIDIDYITGPIALGADESIMLVNVDKSASTGGDVTALEVLTTTGGATTNALIVGADVNPIKQLSGVFVDMDSALVNAVDRLAEFTTIGSDIALFVNDNDTVTIGNAAKFEEIEFLLSVFASQNINPTFEFSTGVGTWTAFIPTDGTNGMRNNGIIAWLDEDIPTWAIGTGSEYLIRITRTRNGLSTNPVESLVQIAEATEFEWDKDGNIAINNLTAAGRLKEDGTKNLGISNFPLGVTDPSIRLYAGKKVDRDITLSEVEVLLIGGTNATLEARFGPTVSAGSGTLIGASAVYTTGQNDVTITTAAVPAGNYVWFEVTAMTGTPTLLTLNFTY